MIDEIYYYQRLRDAQARAIYWEMRNDIARGNVSGSFDLKQHNADSGTINAALDAAHALRMDRPDFFFLGNRRSASMIGTQVKLTYQSDYTPRQIDWIIERKNRFLKELERTAKGADDWETERKVYDAIANRCSYKDNHQPHDHNIVSLLLTNSAVCEGYSCMMILALRRMGIPCIRVSGESRGESHCWNIAWIDGRPSHLDVTWDVPVKGQVPYRYFNLTDAEIRLDHRVMLPNAPVCSSGDNSFFARTGTEFDSAEEARRYIVRALRHRERTVRFRLRARDSAEQCIRSALRRSPDGSYKFQFDENFHSGTIIRVG